MNILIVDDDLAIREMLVLAVMNPEDYIEQAANARQAITCLNQKPFDIVILDMGMPPDQHTPKQGIDVLDAVPTSNSMDCKVIVLTGQDPQKTAYQAIKHGAFDFLTKPIANSTLLQSIDRAKLFLNNHLLQKNTEGVQKIAMDVELGQGVKSVRNAAEKKLLMQVLHDSDFNVHQVARCLGLKRENVYYLINKYAIERPETDG